MTSEFVPIDHKDDSPEYREQVWASVSMRVGSELTPLDESHQFAGVWDVDFDVFGSTSPAYVYRFEGDDEVEVELLAGTADSKQQSTWKVPRSGAISIDGDSFHAAQTVDGRVVMFNGDQSLVMVARRRTG